METPNLPSSSNASTNLPTSLLVSENKLTQAISCFGEDYAAQVFTRYKNAPASIQKAAESNAPTFYDVTNFFTREATLMWLRFHIAETFAFLGIYDTASKGQIVQTAELILGHEIFGQMNLDEFLQFLTQFKRGDYGKIYQSARPNPQEFLACLRPFWNELVEHRIHLAKKKEEERLQKQAEADKADSMSYDEWQEIKMLTRMYEMIIPNRKQ